jgi:D-3-phosphoglycerate dehydrogenase
LKILVTPRSFGKDKKGKAKELLEDFADEIVYNPYDRPLKGEEIVILLKGVNGYIAGLDYITEEVINIAPKCLKVISRYGVGYDRVDIKAAKAKGIIVTNTPGANSESVADMALALILSVARQIPLHDQRVKKGDWTKNKGREVFGKTLGIIGMGSIGKGVALRAKGFSMNILAYDPYIDRDFATANGIIESSLKELLKNADYLTLHTPLNEKTRNIINEEAISKMKDGAVIVNTARGGLIDENAAYKALKTGKLGGLGLDTFEKEPPDSSELFEMENVVLTPHTGANTLEASNNMALMAVENLIRVIEGKDCRYIINSVGI